MTSEVEINLHILRIAVPDGHDPTKPLPLLIKSNPDDPNCWSTGDGGRVYVKPEWAADAMLHDSAEYKEVNAKRYELSRFVKATVVPEDGNMVTLEGGDYFTDVAEMLEQLGDDVVVDGESNLPAWCYATKREGFEYRLFENIASHMSDNHHEDAYDELKDTDELEAFWVAWCAKQTVTSFFIDYQRIIVIDQERYERELADAKAWLEANSNV